MVSRSQKPPVTGVVGPEVKPSKSKFRPMSPPEALVPDPPKVTAVLAKPLVIVPPEVAPTSPPTLSCVFDTALTDGPAA